MSFELFIVIWLGFNLVFAAISAYAASRWGRDPFGWLIVGAVLGPLGFVVLLGMHRDDLRRSRPQLAGPGSRAGVTPQTLVLIAIDGSAVSTRVVEYVTDHFGTSLGEVAVLSVLPIEAAPISTPVEDSPRGRLLEEEVERHLGSACTQLRAAGISCRPITLFGDPAKEIISFAEEGHYDLIVMGRQGRGAVSKALLGSVSDRVVKAASCPVMVVS
jgi:nucleotide-binding universal stress UspA family protein